MLFPIIFHQKFTQLFNFGVINSNKNFGQISVKLCLGMVSVGIRSDNFPKFQFRSVSVSQFGENDISSPDGIYKRNLLSKDQDSLNIFVKERK